MTKVFHLHQPLLLLLICTLPVVSAWPTGAGDCPAGKAAVGGSHVSPDAETTTGTLEEAPQKLQIMLNGIALAADKPSSFPVGNATEITLTSAEGPFRGFLIRIGAKDGDTDLGDSLTTALAPASADESLAKVEESYCAPLQASGVTHTSKDDKTSITASIEVADPAESLMLDVTVVIMNTGGVSEYYYTGYTLNAVEAAEPGTVATDAPDTDISPDPPSADDSSAANVITISAMISSMLLLGICSFII